MELLGVLAFITLILGPIGFFLSLGVRPRLLELERARENANRELLPKIGELEQRLRRIEEYLAKASQPVAFVPAPPAEALTVGGPAAAEPTGAAPVTAAATAAPSDTVTVTPQVEPVEAPPVTEPIVPEDKAPSDAVTAAPQVGPAEAPPVTEPIVPQEMAPTTPEPEAELAPPDAQTAPSERPVVAASARVVDVDQILAAAGAAEPPIPPAPPPTSRAGLRGLEEAIGTRWTVWVGGLALALGAILLVRLSIERGVFGPPVRIALGLLLAAVLVGAGEFLRRRDMQPTGDSRAAYIPGMLTATGTIAAFGTVYAAYALYQFIGATTAFLALGAIGLACMGAASLHGPALAGLGLAGSLVTPLLVQSTDPSPWTLVWYVGIVNTAAHALARLRNWLWLPLVAAAAAGVWGLLMLSATGYPFYRAALAHIVVQTALAALFMALSRAWSVADERARSYRPGEIVLAAAGLLTMWALLRGSLIGHFGTTWLLGAALVTAILALTAVSAAIVASAIAVAGLVVLAAMILWPPLATIVDGRIDRIILLLPQPDDPVRYVVLAVCGCLAIALLAAGRLLRASNLPLATAAPYAAAATLTPLGGLAIAYLRIAQSAASLRLAAAALLLAVAFAAGTWLFVKRRARWPGDANQIGLGAFASAANAAAAFALVFALDGGMLTVEFALAAVGTAFVAVRLDLTALRWCVAALGILVGARLAWDPRIVGGALSTTPIFNWLLFGYGIPALSFVVAGWIMRTRRDDTPVRVADALGVLFAAFLVFFEIRHAMNGGDPFAPASGLVEQGLLAVASFGFGIVLTRLDAARANVIFRIASLAAGAIGMALAVIGLGLRWNPLLHPEPVEGGTILNALLLCYLLPGLLAGLLAMVARQTRPAWYFGGAGAISLAFCVGYLVMQTRLLFHGQVISIEVGATLAELGLDTAFCLIVAAGLAASGGAVSGLSIFRRAALTALGLLAAAIGVLGLGLVHNPLLRPEIVAGGTIFNALIAGYLLPALAAGLLARTTIRAWPPYGQTTAAAGFILALIYLLFEARLLFRGPLIALDRGASLAELGIHTTLCLAIAGGIMAALTRRASPLLNAAFVLVAVLAGFMFLGGPGLGYNPLLRPEIVAGGTIFNTLIVGYLLPALAAGLIAFVAAPSSHRQAAAAVAFILALVYLLLEMRLMFRGPVISVDRGASLAELGIQTTLCLVVAAGILAVLAWRANPLLNAVCIAVLALAGFMFLGGPGLGYNPLLHSQPMAGNAIFNALIPGYLLPALATVLLALIAGWLRPAYARIPGAVASLLALAWLVLEVRVLFHGMSIPIVYGAGISELGIDTAILIVIAIVLIHAARLRESQLLLRGAMVAGAVALVGGTLGLGIFANPLFTGAPVAGNAAFNTLLVGYGLIAALAFVLAREASRRKEFRPPAAFRVAASIASIAALFVYVTLETRRVFQGESIGYWRPTGEEEWYAYSAVWLVLGIVLLAYGVWRRSITVRLASALFVFASVLKVFLFDLAGLEGMLRATSFLGLGVALIGIGLAYQKLVFASGGEGEEPRPK